MNTFPLTFNFFKKVESLLFKDSTSLCLLAQKLTKPFPN